MGAIFLIGAAFALFFAVLLSNKKAKRLPDQVLSAWFLIIMLHLLGYYTYYEKAYLEYPHLLGLEDAFPFLYGPLLFIYTDTLRARTPTFKKSYWLHFIPFLLSNLLYLPYYLADGSRKVDLYFAGELPFIKVVIALKLLAGPVYVVWVWILLKKHRANIQQYFSFREKIDLNWLKHLTFGFGAFLIVVLISFFTEQIVFPINSDFMISTAVAVCVIALGYWGFKQGAIFAEASLPATEATPRVAPGASPPDGKEIQPVKYEKSGLKEKDAKAYLKILTAYMEEEKPYLNSTLTIEEVAKTLDIPRHSLTQIINQKLGKNFYQFVNDYRVEESKKRLLDPANQPLTLLAIGYDSGFNSKSSFNTIFKRATGMTPSQFKKLNDVQP